MSACSAAGDELILTDGRVGRSKWIVIGATVAVCIPILAACQFAALARVDDIDSILFAYYGKRMVAGQALYLDLWDNKPPGIFWVDAISLWLAGGSYAGIVVACSLATCTSAVAFFLLAKRLYGLKAAAVGTVLAALYVNLYYYHVGANRPSTFYVLFELLVMLSYCRSFDPRCRRWAALFAAGACAVGSMCFRQTAVAAMAAVLLHLGLLLVAERATIREVMRRVCWIVAGAAGALVVVIIVLFVTSDVGAAWGAAVVSNLGYVTESRQSRIIPELYGWREHAEVLGLPAILAAAALIHSIATGFARTGALRAPGSHEAHRDDQTGADRGDNAAVPFAFALSLLWLPIAVYLAALGPHKALHYFGIALAPLVLVATRGIQLLLRRDDPSPQPRFHVTLALLWFVYMALPPLQHQADAVRRTHFQRFDERASDRYAATVRTLLAHTAPDDAVYMWHYAPQVYWETDRPQAQRYILETIIDQWHLRAQPFVDETIAALKAKPPTALVVSSRDLRKMEDGDANDAIDYDHFADWLRKNYARPADAPDGEVWLHLNR